MRDTALQPAPRGPAVVNGADCTRGRGVASVLAAAMLWIAAAGQASAQPSAPPPDAPTAFEALLARVKASDPTVDFAELRRLYAESPAYTPLRDADEPRLREVMSRGADRMTLDVARAILERNYLNVDAHLAAAVACEALADMDCRRHHEYVARGILDSIGRSGDGRTLDTAWVVISVPEEYAVAAVLGVRVIGQEVVRRDSRYYDRLTVRDPDSGTDRELFFDIDLIYAATQRSLKR